MTKKKDKQEAEHNEQTIRCAFEYSDMDDKVCTAILSNRKQKSLFSCDLFAFVLLGSIALAATSIFEVIKERGKFHDHKYLIHHSHWIDDKIFNAKISKIDQEVWSRFIDSLRSTVMP